MSQAQNLNTPMICQYNTTLRSTNDQHLSRDRDDAFASRDMILTSKVGAMNMDIMTNESINTRNLNIEEYQKSDTESEEARFVKAMIEKQNQQIKLFETELESINKEMQSPSEKHDYLIKEKEEIEQVL
jgi:hypothetical protein